MYTADKRRFEVPLAYLGTPAFAELLQISEEEFAFMSSCRYPRRRLVCTADKRNACIVATICSS